MNEETEQELSDFKKWMDDHPEEVMEWLRKESELEKIVFTDEELGYRRGYSHGFAAACQNPQISSLEVSMWAKSKSLKRPPGSTSIFNTDNLPGIQKGEEKEFFHDQIRESCENSVDCKDKKN